MTLAAPLCTYLWKSIAICTEPLRHVYIFFTAIACLRALDDLQSVSQVTRIGEWTFTSTTAPLKDHCAILRYGQVRATLDCGDVSKCSLCPSTGLIRRRLFACKLQASSDAISTPRASVRTST